MALSKSGLKNRITQAMVSQGAKTDNEHSWVEKMAEAIADAVIDEITENATVVVASGSSAGEYKVS